MLVPENSSEAGISYDLLSEDGRSSATSAQSTGDDGSVDASVRRATQSASKAMKNFLSPTYESRSEQFRKLFKQVPLDDPFVIDYSCAYQRDMLVHGRLYVTRSRICFHANIFKWETSIILLFSEVENITKERTAMVIPNALQLTTSTGDKYFLTSFARRDRAYTMLHRLWLANFHKQVPSSVTEIWSWVEHSYDERDAAHANSVHESLADDQNTELLDDSQTDTLRREGEARQASPQLPSLSKASSQSVDNVNAPLMPLHRSATSMSMAKQSSPHHSTSCSCEHDGTQLLSQTYNFTVEQLFTMLFTHSSFVDAFNERRNITDAISGDWSSAERTYKYTMALTAAVGPKCSYCTEEQRLLVDLDGVKVIACEVHNGGIPYADSFVVHTRWCITRLGHTRARLLIHGRVHFVKNVWALVKSFIEKPTMSGLDEYFDAMHTELTQWQPSLEPLLDQVDDEPICISRRQSNVLATEPLHQHAPLPQQSQWLAYSVLALMMALLAINIILLYTVYSAANQPISVHIASSIRAIDSQIGQLREQVSQMKALLRAPHKEL